MSHSITLMRHADRAHTLLENGAPTASSPGAANTPSSRPP